MDNDYNQLLSSKKAVKNASWIIVCGIAESIISLIIGMITARYLGPSNYGIINYAASIVAFVTPIMGLGINNVIVQEFINNPSDEGTYLGSSVVLRLISSVLCFFGILIFVMFANANDEVTIIVCLLYSSLVFFQALFTYKYWYQAHYNSKVTSVISLLVYIIVGCYKIFLLVFSKSVFWFALVGGIEYLLIDIALVIVYKKWGGQKLHFSLTIAKKLFSKSKYYIIAELMVVVFQNTDKVMIKIMIGNSATGLYSAAIVCVGLAGFVFNAVLDSFRPLVFESRKIDVTLFETNLKRLYSSIIYLSLLYSMGMCVCSNLVIKILYGEEYLGASSCLRIAVWYVSFSYIGAIRNIWMLAEDKQKYLAAINFIGASANIVLNYFMIPIWGINGGAIASLITQFFTNVVVGYIIKPISHNNAIMLKSVNPKVFIESILILKDRLKKE